MSENRAFGYTSIGLIAFAGIAVVLALLFMPTQADDVYFLNNGSGGGETTECINLASQYQIVLNSTDGNCFIRALANGTNISMTTNSTHIIINSTGGGETTVCAGQTGNYNIVASSSGGDCNFKNLLAGTGITLSSNSTHITITNSSPDNTTCANVGTGKEVYKDGECNFRTLIDGNGITYTQNTNDITAVSYCDNTGSGEAICESGNDINSLIAGEGISITDTTGDLTISQIGSPIEIERASPADGATSFTTDSFTGYKYLQIVLYVKGDSAGATAGDCNIRFNGDTGSNYGERISLNNGAQSTASALTSLQIIDGFDDTNLGFVNIEIVNIASQFKQVQIHSQQGVDSGNISPATTVESFSYWRNTANQITSITVLRSAGTWTFDSTTEIVVFGWN